MRLIDADALMTEFCKECREDVQDDCRHDPMCGSMMWIAEAPTVEDAVVVVRCKDCAFYNEHIYMCKALGLGFPEDFYCACGHRKGEGE